MKNGIGNFRFMGRQMYVLAFACMCLFVSCRKYETVTDTYYISNKTGNDVSLVLSRSVVWDTCVSEDLHRVWFDSNTLPIAAGKAVRLHPIIRTFTNQVGGHWWNVIPVIGSSARLIIGNDTIIWNAERQDNSYTMYASDTRWSIFNMEDWVTVDWKSSNEHRLPDTYEHRFLITDEKIERSKP